MGIEPLLDKWRAFGWEVHEVDGHDVAGAARPAAAASSRTTRAARRPSSIAHTVKGKGVSFMESELGWHLGYLAAEDEERALAEIGGARVKSAALSEGSWHLHTLLDQSPGLRALADTLVELVDEGHPIVACTADLKYSNGLVRFQERHPERFFQFGISEQNMVSAAAGIATTGAAAVRRDVRLVPGAAVLRADPHRRRLLRAAGAADRPPRRVSRSASTAPRTTRPRTSRSCARIAGLAVVAPADGPSLAAALRATVDHPGPIYFRIGRGREPDVYRPDMDFELGKRDRALAGRRPDAASPRGSMVHAVAGGGRGAARRGPLGRRDRHAHDQAARPRGAARGAPRSTRLLMTVEEHNVLGGLGGAVAEVLAEAGVRRATAPPRHPRRVTA